MYFTSTYITFNLFIKTVKDGIKIFEHNLIHIHKLHGHPTSKLEPTAIPYLTALGKGCLKTLGFDCVFFSLLVSVALYVFRHCIRIQLTSVRRVCLDHSTSRPKGTESYAL